MSFSIRLEKENFKFSGTHLTIFSAKDAERLHGHNYYVTVEFGVVTLDPELGMAFDFNLVKPLVRQICSNLDEYVLIPSRSRFLKIERDDGQIRFAFNEKIYSFPASDVRELPVSNITSEELARYLASELKSLLPKNLQWQALTLTVEESHGQSASFSISNSL